MCGIFGVVNKGGLPLDKHKLLETRDTLCHRGPDDAGIFINPDGNTAFTHRRLSIIDLSSHGHQPMSSPDGRYTIIFNGEIYNYKELQKEFNSLKSNSDTEVILQLFVLEGEKCLKKLRGMFAFAIWDDQKKSLFAARDRFGIKPFYYLCKNNQFVFASEVKSIKNYRGNLNTSIRSVEQFLRTGSVAEPQTIYEDVYALPAGNYLYLENNSLDIKKWWCFFDMTSAKDLRKSYNDEAKEEIFNALIDTVQAHMVSDVEVGAFLSGGIDSTAIVSLMRKLNFEKLKTISIVFPGSNLDESLYSRLAAQSFDTEHYEYALSEERILDTTDQFLNSIDQPTVDGINTFIVARTAKDIGLKVVLSGVGGDELFGGYPSFKFMPLIEIAKRNYNNSVLSKGSINLLLQVTNHKVRSKILDYLKNCDSCNPYLLFRGSFTQDELQQLGWNSKLDFLYEEYNGLDFTEAVNISYLESTLYMKNQLLRDSDVFSMAHSLELRVPLVDHVLYERVLPYLQKGNSFNRPKRLFYDSVKNIPEIIHNRKKMGFTFPFTEWMRKGPLNLMIRETIMENAKNSFFDRDLLERTIHTFEEGQLHWSRIWSLFVIMNFMK